jgi:hypothetical protein
MRVWLIALLVLSVTPFAAHAEQLTCQQAMIGDTNQAAVVKKANYERIDAAADICRNAMLATKIIQDKSLKDDEKRFALKLLLYKSFAVESMIQSITIGCSDQKEDALADLERLIVYTLPDKFQSYTPDALRIIRMITPDAILEPVELIGKMTFDDGNPVDIIWFISRTADHRITNIKLGSYDLIVNLKAQRLASGCGKNK